VELRIDGEAKKATALGIGPVDAVFKAIAELTDTKSELERFQVNAITGGMDALGEVSVTVSQGGRRVVGNGAHPDIIVASAKAYVHARPEQARLAQATPRDRRAQRNLMRHILLLPGDGIGPEVTVQARRVLEAAARRARIPLDFEEALIGGAAIDSLGTPLSDETVERARSCRAVLMGAVGGPEWDRLPFEERPERGLLRIRKELGLFANLRPAAVFPALVGASTLRREVVEGIDLLVVRELTGGIYFGEPRGQALVNGTREGRNTMVYDEVEIARIARVAFEAARRRRREVTHVHKANMLEVCQLWIEVVEEVSKDYPDVALEHQLVDSMAMLLLREPRNYDVIVTGNLFGDILSDEAAMITGSLGMLPSASLGEGGVGLYEPVHGSAPDIAGRDMANPLAAILSAAMLLEHSLDAPEAARTIRRAVADALDAGYRTADFKESGGDGDAIGCREMGDRVLEKLEAGE
jgi:3-isopropylmalate dehydrogenase